MITTIQFNDEPQGQTGKVGNIVTNNMLSSEMHS